MLRPWRKGAAPHPPLPGKEPPLGALHARRSPFAIFPRLNPLGVYQERGAHLAKGVEQGAEP